MSGDGDEWTSLPLREATRDRFRTHRPQEASSADAFLNTLLDEYESVESDTVDLAERLDRIESAAKEATSAAQSTQRAIEDMEKRR